MYVCVEIVRPAAPVVRREQFIQAYRSLVHDEYVYTCIDCGRKQLEIKCRKEKKIDHGHI